MAFTVGDIQGRLLLDVDPYQAGLAQARADAAAFEAEHPTATFNANTATLNATVAEAMAKINAVGAKTATATLGLDTGTLYPTLGEAQTALADFAKQLSSAQLGATAKPFWADIGALRAELGALSPFDVSVGATVAAALTEITALKGALASAQTSSLAAAAAMPAWASATQGNLGYDAAVGRWRQMSGSTGGQFATVAQLAALAAALKGGGGATLPAGALAAALGQSGTKGSTKGWIASLLGGLLGGGAAGGGGAGGLLSALGWGGGGGIGPWLGGMASFGSLLSMMGFGAEHVAATGVGVAGSLAGAGLGAGFLGLGALGTMGVGMGTDMAGIGQAFGDTTSTLTAMTKAVPVTNAILAAQVAYNKALITGGINSAAFATATKGMQTALASYNQTVKAAIATNTTFQAVLGGFSPVAQQAVVAAAEQANALHMLFNAATGTAERIGANILNQAMQVGEQFLPTIGKYATQNMGIIQSSLQPFFKWLDTAGSGGLKIFTNLENVFQAHLPTGMHAIEQGFELLAKTITIASQSLGPFLTMINKFLTRMNGATFGKWSKFVGDMIKSFTDWFSLLTGGATRAMSGLGGLIGFVIDLFQPAVGLGDQLAQLLTQIFNQIDGWLVSTHNLLHDLFTAHAKELITGIGAIIKAALPIVEAFASAFVQFATGGAMVALPILRSIADILGAIDKIPFASDIIGWGVALALFGPKVAAGLVALTTSLGGLADAAVTPGAAFVASTIDVNAFDEALVQLGITADAVGPQVAAMAAEVDAAGASAAAGGAETAVGAGAADAAGGLAGDAGLAEMLGPAGMLAAGAVTVGALVLSLTGLGKKGPTVQAVNQAMQSFSGTLSSLPTTSLLHITSDLITLTKELSGFEGQLKNLTPNTTQFTIVSQKIGAVSSKILQLGTDASHQSANIQQLGSAFGLTTAQVKSFAQTAGITLNKALTVAKVRLFRTALKQSGTAAVVAKAQMVQSAATIVAASANEATQVQTHDSALVQSMRTSLGSRLALAQSTGTRALATLVNATNGGLPAVEAADAQWGVTIPAKYLGLLKAAAQATGKESMAKLTTAIQVAFPTYEQMWHRVATVPTDEATVARGAAAALGDGEVTALVAALTAKKGTITSHTQQLIYAALTTAKGEAASQAALVGAAIAGGIANGVLSGAGTMQGAIKSVIYDAQNTAMHAIQAHSPSVLFAQTVGLPISQGIAVGIASGTAAAVTAAKTAMLALVAAFKVSGASLTKTLQAMMVSAISALTAAIPSLGTQGDLMAENLASQLKDAMATAVGGGKNGASLIASTVGQIVNLIGGKTTGTTPVGKWPGMPGTSPPTAYPGASVTTPTTAASATALQASLAQATKAMAVLTQVFASVGTKLSPTLHTQVQTVITSLTANLSRLGKTVGVDLATSLAHDLVAFSKGSPGAVTALTGILARIQTAIAKLPATAKTPATPTTTAAATAVKTLATTTINGLTKAFAALLAEVTTVDTLFKTLATQLSPTIVNAENFTSNLDNAAASLAAFTTATERATSVLNAPITLTLHGADLSNPGAMKAAAQQVVDQAIETLTQLLAQQG